MRTRSQKSKTPSTPPLPSDSISTSTSTSTSASTFISTSTFQVTSRIPSKSQHLSSLSPSPSPSPSPSAPSSRRVSRAPSHSHIDASGVESLCTDDECVCPTALSSLSICGSNSLSRYALLTYDALPCWLKDNCHVQSGYRVDMGWRRSCESLCHLHNETINVWSHLLGFCMVACLLIITLATMSPHGIDRIQLGVQLRNSTDICPINVATPHVPPSALSPFSSLSFDFMSHTQKDDGAPRPASLFSHMLASDSFTHMLSSMNEHLPSIQQVTANLREKADDMMTLTEETASSLVSNTTRQAFLQYVEAMENQLRQVKQSLNELCTPDCSSLASSQWDSVRTSFATQVQGVQHMFEHLAEDGEAKGADLMKVTQQLLHDFSTRLANIKEPRLAALSLVPVSVQHGIEHIVMLQNLHSFLARWPLTVFLLSAMACLLFSSIYHLFVSVSRRIALMLQCLDYAGINLLIAGSNVPVIYYGLYCAPFWAFTYILIACTLAVIGFTISVLPTFRSYKYRGTKTAIFVGTGVWGVVPMMHMIFHLGEVHFIFWYMLVMGACYLLGALIYLVQIPERWLPGKFDYFFHSHQLWHIMVFIAVMVHYVGVMHMYEWRIRTTCQAQGI